jgi:UPF0755 protein
LPFDDVKMKKVLLYIVPIVFLVLLIIGYLGYRVIFGVSVSAGKDKQELLIPSNATFDQVMDTLESKLQISKPEMLRWVAIKKGYPAKIKPGRYLVEGDWSSIQLINLLRSGAQTPVKVTFNNIRNLNQLAGKIGKVLETDSLAIIGFLMDESNYAADGFKKETIISVFIPDTYEFYWNTSASGLYERMLREYRLFWNEDRRLKAESQGLDPVGVAILASIIDDEVTKKDEKPRIAGVYLNRLKRGIPLQACPTIKFALNDYTITRVLYVHLETDSPYNTYKHRGLPPGPVGCPSKEGLEAVLNSEQHDYLYFAAKADFSGYHNFSRTLAEHNRYANQYQRELDKRRIFK